MMRQMAMVFALMIATTGCASGPYGPRDGQDKPAKMRTVYLEQGDTLDTETGRVDRRWHQTDTRAVLAMASLFAVSALVGSATAHAVQR